MNSVTSSCLPLILGSKKRVVNLEGRKLSFDVLGTSRQLTSTLSLSTLK